MADLNQKWRMPALFVGHGSPMNALEENRYTLAWKKVAAEIPKPEIILCISAHWLTQGTFITYSENPKTIHDFGGFPPELFAVQYPAMGSPEWAEKIRALIPEIGLDEQWGLDHGSWSILKQMYPKADIPVLQLSIDYYKPPQFHYDFGKRLAALRDLGVLIVGSGNMVHNLRQVAFDRINEDFGFDWALSMDDYCQTHIRNGNHQALIDYQQLGPAARLSVPSPDHYYPLLYILGIQEKEDIVHLFNQGPIAGSLTMTSVMLTPGALDVHRDIEQSETFL